METPPDRTSGNNEFPDDRNCADRPDCNISRTIQFRTFRNFSSSFQLPPNVQSCSSDGCTSCDSNTTPVARFRGCGAAPAGVAIRLKRWNAFLLRVAGYNVHRNRGIALLTIFERFPIFRALAASFGVDSGGSSAALAGGGAAGMFLLILVGGGGGGAGVAAAGGGGAAMAAGGDGALAAGGGGFAATAAPSPRRNRHGSTTG